MEEAQITKVMSSVFNFLIILTSSYLPLFIAL